MRRVSLLSLMFSIAPVFASAQPCALPPRDCTGTATECAALIPFEPVQGVGYHNYPINGETPSNQHRSFARRDLVLLVKYAAAVVQCTSTGWVPGNGHPIGLGDMSERNGSIPGTSNGNPGHPANTHVNGRDIDIAYYQLKGENNHLRPVCAHTSGGVTQQHCIAAPDNLDTRRTALFIGAFFTSNRTRVIGVDGKIGPLIGPEMDKLCKEGALPQLACDRRRNLLAWETTNSGQGWYFHHHHHLHLSLKKIPADATEDGLGQELAPGNKLLREQLLELLRRGAPGHVRSMENN